MVRPRASARSSSHLAILTPNQREKIIKKERERRRLIRYEQVRQLSAENAAKIRERVKEAKQIQMEEIKKRITDAIVQRNHLAPEVVSPASANNTQSARTTTPRRSRRRSITPAEIERASRRHREALQRMLRERERERRRRELVLQRRRQARQIADARSRRT